MHLYICFWYIYVSTSLIRCMWKTHFQGTLRYILHNDIYMCYAACTIYHYAGYSAPLIIGLFCRISSLL